MPTYKDQLMLERVAAQHSHVFKRKDNWRRQITIFAETETEAKQALVENVKKNFNEPYANNWFLYSINGEIQI